MRSKPDAEFVRQCDNPEIFGDAADLDHRGLRVAYRARFHHLSELMNRARILAGRNVEPALGPHFCERCKILRRPDRLLEEHRRGVPARMRGRTRGSASQW